MTVLGSLGRDLATLVGPEYVLPGDTRQYLSDATETRALRGRADAIVLPDGPESVAAVVAWCYEHGVPIVPRGGGTGFAGGAVPLEGGVVLGLERLRAPPRIDGEYWRAYCEAGVTTAHLRRRAREEGLLFGPDPGAAEQSQIGGNIATNAGGPHAFKYGVTGAWVTGLEAVLAPGEIVTIGGSVRKDVAGYDLKSLLVGSEGTLAIITGAWLRLLPAPEAALPVVAFYQGAEDGTLALRSVLQNGLTVAVLEYLEGAALAAAAGSFPAAVPDGAGFAVIAEADGTVAEAAQLRDDLVALLGPDALSTHAPIEARAVRELWQWRDGVSLAVTAQRGGKVSEDIAVPLDRLGEAIQGTLEIGARHRLETCSWGHAGDGNLHSTFLIDSRDPDELARAEAAADELFDLALRLGGTVSGEHGTGVVKRSALSRQLSPAATRLHEAIKDVFDPKGLLNPGKKMPL